MKLLFVLTNLSGGGAERGNLQLMDGLVSAGYEVSLFLLKAGGELADIPIHRDVKIHVGLNRRSRFRFNLLKLTCALSSRAKEHDVIIGGLELYPTYFAYVAGLFSGKPVVGCIQNHLRSLLKYKSWFHGFLIPLIYPRLQHIVQITQHCVDGLKAFTHINPDKLSSIPNAFDFENLRKLSEEDLPEPYKWVPDEQVILAVGRMMPQKNFQFLIRAHAALRENGGRHHLVILGEGPLKEDLSSLAKALNVGDSVHFPGFFINPYPFFKSATLLALSSDFEGMAMVLVEAQILGLPIVALNCPTGVSEVLEKGKSGLLVDPGDFEGFMEGIECLLGSARLREKYSESASRGLSRFSVKNIVNKWDHLLLELDECTDKVIVSDENDDSP